MSNSKPTNAEIEICFGTKRRCNRECHLKELCASEAKEKTEDARRKQFRETEFIDAMDSESDDHHVNREFLTEQERTEDTSGFDVYGAIDAMDAPEPIRAELKRLYERREERDKGREDAKEMLSRLGELYVFDQQGFEALFFQILTGCNQSMIARMHRCSKQNISKKLTKGKERLAAHRKQTAARGREMSGRELGVYFYVFMKKLTIRKTAEILGISHTAVRKIIQKLEKSKLAVSKKTHLPRAVKVFRKKTAGEELSETELAIYNDITNEKNSIREAAKKYRCSVSTVVSMRKQSGRFPKNASS